MSESQRYILFQCFQSGLGHVLTSVLNCAYAARATKRSLVLDMRRFRYFKSDPHAEFFLNFVLHKPADLDLITDIGVVQSIYEIQSRIESGSYIGIDLLKEREETLIIVQGTAIIDAYNLKSKSSPLEFQIILVGDLKVAVDLRLEGIGFHGLERIGIYFRHGNGEYLNLRFDSLTVPDYDLRYEGVLLRFADLARVAGKAKGWRSVEYFAACDSDSFTNYMMKELPRCHVNRNDTGGTLWYSAVDNGGFSALVEAASDLWALSSCRFILFSTSLFSRFACLNSDHIYEMDAAEFEEPGLPKLLEKMEVAEAISFCRDLIHDLQLKWPIAVRDIIPLLISKINSILDLGAVVDEKRVKYLLKERNYYTSEQFAFALSNIERGNYIEAANTLLSDHSEYGSNAYLHRHAAELFSLGGNMNAANTEYRRSIAICPDLAETHRQLGNLLMNAGNYAGASREMDTAVRLGARGASLSKERAKLQHFLNCEQSMLNVAFGKTATQSSISEWSRLGESQRAVNGFHSGRYSFHTSFEHKPWWMVDLAHSVPIRRIVVYNRDDMRQEAAGTLRILRSNAPGEEFEAFVESVSVFGGSRSGKPLVVELSPPLPARYVKLQLRGYNALHLDEVEIYSLASDILRA